MSYKLENRNILGIAKAHFIQNLDAMEPIMGKVCLLKAVKKKGSTDESNKANTFTAIICISFLIPRLLS